MSNREISPLLPLEMRVRIDQLSDTRDSFFRFILKKTRLVESNCHGLSLYLLGLVSAKLFNAPTYVSEEDATDLINKNFFVPSDQQPGDLIAFYGYPLFFDPTCTLRHTAVRVNASDRVFEQIGYQGKFGFSTIRSVSERYGSPDLIEVKSYRLKK